MAYYIYEFGDIRIIASDDSPVIAVGAVIYDVLEAETGRIIEENVIRGHVPNALADAEKHACLCGAPTNGKWADKHSRDCPAVS